MIQLVWVIAQITVSVLIIVRFGVLFWRRISRSTGPPEYIPSPEDEIALKLAAQTQRIYLEAVTALESQLGIELYLEPDIDLTQYTVVTLKEEF